MVDSESATPPRRLHDARICTSCLQEFPQGRDYAEHDCPGRPVRPAPAASPTANTDLLVGDRIKLQHGPFVATWEVVEIIDAGARLAYCGDVRFVGHARPQVAPSGVALTEDREHAFLGRAHWPATPRWRA